MDITQLPTTADNEASADLNRRINDALTHDDTTTTLPTRLWNELADEMMSMALQIAACATETVIAAGVDPNPPDWTPDSPTPLVDHLTALQGRAIRAGITVVACRTLTLAAIIDQLQQTGGPA